MSKIYPDLKVNNVAPFSNKVIQTAMFHNSEHYGLTLDIPFIYGTRYYGNFSYSIGKDSKTDLPIFKEDFQYAIRQSFADSIIYIDKNRYDLGFCEKYQETIIEGSLEGLSLIALYGAVYEQYIAQTDKNEILTLYLNDLLYSVNAEIEEVEDKAQELYATKARLESYLPRP